MHAPIGVKPVEFGAKVHKVQVGGLSFIEHLSYENFNESTRLKQSIAFHQKHFGKCSQLAADVLSKKILLPLLKKTIPFLGE